MSPLPTVDYMPLDASWPEAEKEEVSVSTVAATAVATGHHMFKIEGYSRLKAMDGENGSYIQSSAFKVGGHTWRIRCYLNGYTKESAGYVSLFLYLCGAATAGSAVHAEYELALVSHLALAGCTTPPANGDHQGSLSKTSQGVRAFGGKKDKTEGWGVPCFISVKELEGSSRFLRDDCFAVRCTVTVVKKRGTVEEKAVQADDLARLGMLCKCEDDMCKRHHARPAAAAAAETFLERFANFCYSICRGGPV